MLFLSCSCDLDRQKWVEALRRAVTVDENDTNRRLFSHTLNTVLQSILEKLGTNEAEVQSQRVKAAAMILFIMVA